MIHSISGTAFASLSCQASEGRADEFTNNDIRNSFCRVEHSALCAGQVEGTYIMLSLTISTVTPYLCFDIYCGRYFSREQVTEVDENANENANEEQKERQFSLPICQCNVYFYDYTPRARREWEEEAEKVITLPTWRNDAAPCCNKSPLQFPADKKL